ncbi:hypothetical protein AK830_g2790 [Neonectria ditissima]|uniref:F-box domain-containing protein n=1 Tax=Neonectria ditissima TaxID=78410 RepID=A0A0N8H872_9HYPO|nr:hypothetical protein AK830_g2790 [Neonectria ditissima]
MSLFRLPSENLDQIFDLVGSSFFRQDLSRLTVSKQWLEFAHRACFKYISLTEENIQLLPSSEGAIYNSALQPSYLKSLDLSLKLRGYQYWLSQQAPQPALESEHLDGYVPNNLAPELASIRIWAEAMNHGLTQLATMIRRTGALQTLRIRAWCSPDSGDYPRTDDALPSPPIRALLSLDSLRVLVLDLDAQFLCDPWQRRSEVHICPTIGTLLRTLNTLHVRMPHICLDALKPDGHDKLRLRNLAINLSMSRELGGALQVHYAKRCDDRNSTIRKLLPDMRQQAKVVASRMSAPKTVRILTHTLPIFRKHSLDVLTDRTMLMHSDMAWDEDGVTIDEDLQSNHGSSVNNLTSYCHE